MENEKASPFRRRPRPPATAHQWLHTVVCNDSANQITAFALVYQKNFTNTE